MGTEEPLRNIIFVSDTHCGCRLGLCPTENIYLDQGGSYYPSELQVKLWGWWTEFWDEWVPTVTRGEPFGVVVVGDSINGVPHGSNSNISNNLVDQRRIAELVLRPVYDRCAMRKDGQRQFYMVRGTEAHVGKSGQEEEQLAKNLGAIPDDQGNFAWYELWLRVGGPTGALVHAMHHIGTTGRTHYESSALMAELGESFAEAGRWRREAPDVIIRGHRHRSMKVEAPTAHGTAIVHVLPGWQLKTPYVYSLPGGRTSTPQCGGILVRQGDEEFYTRSRVFDISRPTEVVV